MYYSSTTLGGRKAMRTDSPEQFISFGNRRLSSAFAIIFHVGMATIVFSCVFTAQPVGYYSRPFFLLIGALGVATIVALLASRVPFASIPAGKALTALVAAFVYNLAYEPQIAQLLPAATEHLPHFVLEFTPGIGVIGLIIALVGTGLYLMARSGREPVATPLVPAVVVGGVLILVLSLIMYIALSPITSYELQGDYLTKLLTVRVVEYTLLLLAVLRLTGARGIGNAPTWYLALALILAAARHILGIAMPDMAS
jgi:hypothetical protein